MKMEEQEFQILLKQYADHRISRDGYDKMLSYVKENGVEGFDKVMLKDWEEMEYDFPLSEFRSDGLYQKILNDPEFNRDRLNKESIVIFYWKKIAVAAAVLFILGAGVFFFRQSIFSNQTEFVNDIAPGGNNAKLILANGKTIDLKRAAQGVLVNQNGFQIKKTDNGQIIYENGNLDQHDIDTGFNSIETPRGGQYKVILPDGSKVWLNAMSRLEYPVSFSGKQERRVQLIGEAYFEISKDKKHPFKVKTLNQQVEVLGTHFNMSSYAEDQEDKTTLLEGSVKINNSLLLEPGQQAIRRQSGHWQVQETNSQDAIAWKDGLFVFEDEKLESIMHKIARWYNVTVVFEGVTSKEGFSGSISRYEQVSKVLRMLELTELVHFKIQGRTITVTK